MTWRIAGMPEEIGDRRDLVLDTRPGAIPAILGVYDTFTDADDIHLHDHSPEKGGPWVDGKGVWDIASNQAALHTTAGWDEWCGINGLSADVTIQCTVVKSANPENAGIMFRDDGGIVSRNNWSFGPYSPGSYWQWGYWVGGAFSLIGTSAVGYSDGTHILKVVLSGDSISMYADGGLVAAITNATHNDHTYHGLTINSATGAGHTFDTFWIM